MRAFLWFMAGVLIAGAICGGLFGADLVRRNLISPFVRAPEHWTNALRYAIQDKYPGGFFQNSTGDYYRCERNANNETVWVVYFANHDLTWTDRGCWNE